MTKKTFKYIPNYEQTRNLQKDNWKMRFHSTKLTSTLVLKNTMQRQNIQTIESGLLIAYKKSFIHTIQTRSAHLQDCTQTVQLSPMEKKRERETEHQQF